MLHLVCIPCQSPLLTIVVPFWFIIQVFFFRFSITVNYYSKKTRLQQAAFFEVWRKKFLYFGVVRERSLTIGREGGPVNFGGGLCFLGRPFGLGHNFMDPRSRDGYNFWAPFIKTLGDVHKRVLCY